MNVTSTHAFSEYRDNTNPTDISNSLFPEAKKIGGAITKNRYSLLETTTSNKNITQVLNISG